MAHFLGRVFAPPVLSSDTTVTLHDRVSSDLGKRFAKVASIDSGDSGADLVIRQGDDLAIIEVKTGDPDRPLPSSASAQMRNLADNARRVFGKEGVRKILPVLVTNYKMSDVDRIELDKYGIKFVELAPTLSLYDADELSREVASIVGLEDMSESTK